MALMTTTTLDRSEWIGATVSNATLRDEDLAPAFLDALGELDPAAEFKIRVEYLDTIVLLEVFGTYEMSEKALDGVGWLMEALYHALDAAAPEGTYFSSHEGDGACFGFWPIDDEDEDSWSDDDGLTDVEADAMTLRDAGWGTDEDYGMIGGDSDLGGEW